MLGVLGAVEGGRGEYWTVAGPERPLGKRSVQSRAAHCSLAFLSAVILVAVNVNLFSFFLIKSN